jgi:hypothetical protein
MQMRNLMATAIFCCLTALRAAAPTREVLGVKMPETIAVDDKVLRLDGIGVRKEKLLFNVYVVAFYLEQPTRDAQLAIVSDQEKRIQLSMLRDITRQQFIQALETAILLNSREGMPALRSRLDLLESALPAPKKGDQLSLTYVPGVGTLLRSSVRELTIPGKDFADALLSVWLGPKPISGTLKRQLLAG